MLTQEECDLLTRIADALERRVMSSLDIPGITSKLRQIRDRNSLAASTQEKIRIAVAVNDNLEWSSAGWKRKLSGDKDEHFAGCALDGLTNLSSREHVYFIEAPLIPPPEPATHEAQIVPAEQTERTESC